MDSAGAEMSVSACGFETRRARRARWDLARRIPENESFLFIEIDS